MFKKILVLIILFSPLDGIWAQNDDFSSNFDDDLENTDDIFTDFQEDLGSKQMQEDERFYRYGRFVSTSFGIGITSFTGNRGKAYHDKNPTLALGLIYFSDFQNAFGMGIDYSKHTMYSDSPTTGSGADPYGAIDITFIRPYISYRYYIDTSDLSSILTYANPYFTGRLEYWYQSRKFKDYDGASDTSGAVGAAAGMGIEIPIDLNKNFIGLQALVHQVALGDSDTEQFQVSSSCSGSSCYGYEDLKGTGFSIITSYLFSW